MTIRTLIPNLTMGGVFSVLKAKLICRIHPRHQGRPVHPLIWGMEGPHLVSVLDAAAGTIVILAPALVPDVGAVLGPLVCILVGPPSAAVPLAPLFLPFVALDAAEPP